MFGNRFRAAVMIDGGYLRVVAQRSGRQYNPDLIEKVARSCSTGSETLFRVLYYDCAPYVGTVTLPISGDPKEFKGSDGWLRDLAKRDLFAVRRGVLKFRGFKPKKIPIASEADLTDDDFKPDFEQKGVDMRIGLDIANYATEKAADRIILITGDTDCLPAMKYARTKGLQIILIALPDQRLAPELLWHSDYERAVPWPT